MSNEEILAVKEDIHEMKGDIKGLVIAMSDLKVSIAENYIKKTDCRECKESKQQFWDAETKKAVVKWLAVVALAVIVLLAGKNLAEITNILPK